MGAELVEGGFVVNEVLNFPDVLLVAASLVILGNPRLVPSLSAN